MEAYQYSVINEVMHDICGDVICFTQLALAVIVTSMAVTVTRKVLLQSYQIAVADSK